MKIDISIKELFAEDSKLHCYEKITVMINCEVLYLTVENSAENSKLVQIKRNIRSTVTQSSALQHFKTILTIQSNSTIKPFSQI